MSRDLADELERLIERDAVWESAELGRCAHRLTARDGEPAASLALCLGALEARLGAAADDRLRRDVESILYPRLWKLLEAVRDGLPAGEQLNRVRALDRRLHDLLGPGPA